MLCSGLDSKHAEYPSPTADVQDDAAAKQVLIVIHGIAVGESSDLVLEHFFMYACVVGP